MATLNEMNILREKAEELIETWIHEYESWDDGEYDEDEIEACISALSKVSFKVVVEER